MGEAHDVRSACVCTCCCCAEGESDATPAAGDCEGAYGCGLEGFALFFFALWDFLSFWVVIAIAEIIIPMSFHVLVAWCLVWEQEQVWGVVGRVDDDEIGLVRGKSWVGDGMVY